ncbi:MAG: UDP-2,3-diacylglucosamine diphosphatase [Gammaproteobacteria bacterium]|nr:UDP-2,3-diacylglucosamine diphosphatase [Gammaproteobacteria bacterium]
MRQETLFISDLHLKASEPKSVQRFLSFLDNRASQAERLFILGDLFDAYLGDDDEGFPFGGVKKALKRLTDQGTLVYFQAGNRDFLVDQDFSHQTGVELLGDIAIIDLYGMPTLLMHGDLLCTDDLGYQNARIRVRTPEWRAYALGKPLWMRKLYARWYRFKSGLDKRGKTMEIMDVKVEKLSDWFYLSGEKRHGSGSIRLN